MANFPVNASANLSTLGYLADDDLIIAPNVTLTITATPPRRIRSIQATGGGGKLLVQNTSTTNMLKLSFTPGGQGAITTGIASLRFENNAECEFAGDWITVYTGDGTANQTVFANLTVGGQLIDIPTFVEVETGSGTGVYEKWSVVPRRSTTTFHNSQYGYNSRNPSTGTVSITAGGVVTLTGGSFVDEQLVVCKRFRAAGHASDYLISAFTNTTTVTLSNPDGSTYTGGAIGAGATYVIRIGSAVEQDDFGNGEHGTVLFLDPFGGAALGAPQAITCGDGTNGKVIPNGAKVRVPNIYVGADLASTTLAAAINGTAAQPITLTSGANFPATNTQWVANNTAAGTLLVYDPATGYGERIGYTTISANVVSATGMTRGAFNSEARAGSPTISFPSGSTVYFIPHPNANAGLNFTDFDAGGQLTCDKVMFGFNFVFANQQAFRSGRNVTLKNVGYTGSFIMGTAVQGDLNFDNFSFTADFRNVGNTNANRMTITSVGGTLTMKNMLHLYSADYCNTTAGTVVASVTDCLTVSEITNYKSLYVKPLSSGSRSLTLIGIGPCAVSNLKLTGTLTTQTIDSCIFDGIYVSGGCTPAFVSFSGSVGMSVGANTTNCIFRGIQNLESVQPNRAGFISSGTSSRNNIFNNKTYSTFNFRNSGDGTFFSDTGTENLFAYFDFINSRDSTSPISANQNNKGQRLIKITSDQYNSTILTTSTGLRTAYQGYRDIVFGPQVNSSVAFNLDVNPFTVMTDGTGSGSAGYLCFGPLLAEDKYTGTYSGLTTTTYLNGTGALAITTNGDQVTVGNQYSQKGISSFNTGGSITIVGNTTGTVTAGAFNGVNYEFRMCNWGDSLTALAWQSLTLTNLENARAALAGYSTSVGINMQIRATATTTVAARTLILIRMPITWDTSYTPAVGTIDLNVTGVVTGSMVAVSTDGGTAWPAKYKATATGSTVTIPIDCNFLGTTTNLKVRIRKAGYQVLEYDLSTVDADVNLPIEQVQVVDIDGVAVYGRGAGTTTAYITIVPGSLRVDIGNILVVGEDLYDVCAAYQATTAGIVYPEILQFDGTDSIILNTWKLRRDVAGSTNAMIDMIVKYGPSVITNPVDEANGSVQLFPRTVRQGSLGAIAATVWDYQTSSATTSGSMGERLKDASTVATNGQQLTAALS